MAIHSAVLADTNVPPTLFFKRAADSSALSESDCARKVPLDASNAFYRLLVVLPPAAPKLSQSGEGVFGYADAFAQELQQIGQITPEQFAANYPNPAAYSPGISWEPTNALFWNEFQKSPPPGLPDPNFHDYRLNIKELALFQKNGFVVTDRLPIVATAFTPPSFGSVFQTIWHDDLPVFISCDAMLEAWHRPYDAIPEETEETYLMNSVQAILDGMAAQIPSAATTVGDGPLKDSLYDADYFVAAARSLLAGTNNPVPSILGQDARVAETLAHILDQKLLTESDFMGFCRVVDYSQFTVRGHYTHTERLGRYFKCMMWLGRIDVPVAGGPFERCPGDLRMASPRELGLAIVLWSLINQAGQLGTWTDIEKTIELFVGWTDSLTVPQLGGVLAGGGIRTLADISSVATLEKIQADLASGELGVQNIRSGCFFQPLSGSQRYGLPQTFAVFGQKFVPDSWAFSQTVFSSIQWVENGVTNKVQRRLPSALDAAFAVLGNNQVVPDIVLSSRLRRTADGILESP